MSMKDKTLRTLM